MRLRREIAIFERAARERPKSLPPLELARLYELMSDTKLREGSAERALEFAGKELEFGMRFLIANPSNIAAQRIQGVANRQLGLAREASGAPIARRCSPEKVQGPHSVAALGVHVWRRRSRESPANSPGYFH